MRIVIPTIGSRGSVQPCIALAQGFGKAGHGEQFRAGNGLQNSVRLIEEAFNR
jgi:UDP:flavonoid glycosyltransferase YjiC (YdhE family)